MKLFLRSFLLFSLLFSAGACSTAQEPQPLHEFTAKVVGVMDGDTFNLTVTEPASGRIGQVRIRMNGIDAPEKDQPYGQKAKQFLSDWIFGKEVTIVTHSIDRYGRTIGDVYLPGDRAVSINERLVMEGFAWHYKQYSDDPTLAAHELTARKLKKGLWADPDPIAPWDWRRRGRN